MTPKEWLVSNTGQFKVIITYISEAKLKKKGCPYGTVKKMGLYTGVIGKSHHQAELDSLSRRQIDYQLPPPQARKWGSRVGNSSVIEHEGKFYVEVTEVAEMDVSYWQLDQQIEYEDIVPWLVKRGEIVPTRVFDLAVLDSIAVFDENDKFLFGYTKGN